jgi:diguanylate cyclase (GGDEF)-like protein
MPNLLHSNLILYVALFAAIVILVAVSIRYYVVLQDNRRLQVELEHVATTDALTGIANRRFFEETLAREIKRAQRYGRQLTLLMIDLNNFKNYNDRHGRPMGDQLLRDCAHLMKALIRASDLVARYGGDEFVVLLPEITARQGKSVADKLRKIKIGSLASKEEIAISIGCAAYKKEMTADALIELAEKDMQKQKIAPAGK